MRDVSRVEYDAALKRFLDAFDAHMVSSVSRRTFGPMVEARRALAALGLDEPPTDPQPFDVRDHPMAFPATADALREQIANEVEAMSSPLLEERVALSGVVLSAVAARIRSGPPAEPPKADEPPTEAMLTCGCGAQRAHESARGQVGCPHCRTPFRAVVPPTEPPKACPTCGSGWTYHHACPDRGSGIDGGTQR